MIFYDNLKSLNQIQAIFILGPKSDIYLIFLWLQLCIHTELVTEAAATAKASIKINALFFFLNRLYTC